MLYKTNIGTKSTNMSEIMVNLAMLTTQINKIICLRVLLISPVMLHNIYTIRISGLLGNFPKFCHF